MKKNFWIHVGLIVAMFAMSCIYLSPALSGKAIVQGDTQKGDAMAYQQTLEQEQTGEMPTWNKSMFSGMPGYQIYTKPIKSVFNDIKHMMIMRDLGISHDIAIIFLYLLGFYLALLALGLSPWLALVGALGFGFGSYNIIIIEAGHITKAWCMAMMAPIFGGMLMVLKGAFDTDQDKRSKTQRLVWGSILFTFALIMQISLNHIQITFYTAIGCVAIGVAYLIYSIIQHRMGAFAMRVGILVVCAALALACNVRHLLVNEEYSRYTMRGGNELTVTPASLYGEQEAEGTQSTSTGLDINYAFSWSYGVGETYTLLVPGAMGGGSGEKVDLKNSEFYKDFQANLPQYQYPWGDRAPLYWGGQPFTSGPVYFGAIIIMLFVMGMIVTKGPERWWILAATVISILMSWGSNFMSFNEWIFNHIPYYSKFRTPSMSLVIANVCMVILAALTLKTIFDRERDRKAINRGLYIATGSLVGFILVVMALSGSFDFSAASDSQLPEFLRESLKADRKSLLMSDSWRSIIFILLAAAVIWLYNNEKLKKAGIAIALVGALVLIDLWGVDKRYLSDDNFVTKSNLEMQPDPYDYEIDRQASQCGDHDYRVLNLAVNTFNDSKPSAFHDQIGGYSATKLSRYQNLIDFYMSRHLKPEVLAMLNTRYVVMQDGQVQRLPNALGNAWFVQEVKPVGNANEEILALNSFNPAVTAVVDTSKYKTSHSQFAVDSNATIALVPTEINMPGGATCSADYKKYATHSATDQLAVFSEIHYDPDWFAYIDGKPAEYIRVNYVLRAIEVPAGDHVIEFKNEAPRMHQLDNVNLVISIATLLLMVGAVVLVYTRKDKKTLK